MMYANLLMTRQSTLYIHGHYFSFSFYFMELELSILFPGKDQRDNLCQNYLSPGLIFQASAGGEAIRLSERQVTASEKLVLRVS